MSEAGKDPQNGDQRAAPASGLNARVVATLAAAAVALAGIYYVARGGAGGEIALGEGGVKIAFHKSDSIADLIDRAVAQQPEQFRALLARHDFYGIQDVRWTNRLREVELQEDVRQSVRRLLFDLAGPFSPPGTLSEADTRLYDAVRELNDALRTAQEPAKPANPFFTAIWRDQFDQKGLFETRAFSARVINLNVPPATDEIGRHVVYVCAQELHDRDVSVVLNEAPRTSGMIGAVGRLDQLRFPCPESTDTLSHYLARHPARFGLPRDSFVALYGEPDPGHTLPPQARALFQVAPINYVPAERRGAEGG